MALGFESAASSISTGTIERPARKISATNGVHCQTSMTMMATKAPVGFPSQSDDAMPNKLMNWLATPNSRLKISRPIRPTTA